MLPAHSRTYPQRCLRATSTLPVGFLEVFGAFPTRFLYVTSMYVSSELSSRSLWVSYEWPAHHLRVSQRFSACFLRFSHGFPNVTYALPAGYLQVSRGCRTGTPRVSCGFPTGFLRKLFRSPISHACPKGFLRGTFAFLQDFLQASRPLLCIFCALQMALSVSFVRVFYAFRRRTPTCKPGYADKTLHTSTLLPLGTLTPPRRQPSNLNLGIL